MLLNVIAGTSKISSRVQLQNCISQRVHISFLYIRLACRSELAKEYSLYFSLTFSSVQFNSVAQSCPTLCDPMNHSTPGLPEHHQLQEFTQTQVHRVHDAIQPSHPLSSPSLPAPNPSQHQSLFQWVNSLTLLDCNVFWLQVHIANALGSARFCFILPPRVRQAPSPFSGHLLWYILEYRPVDLLLFLNHFLAAAHPHLMLYLMIHSSARYTAQFYPLLFIAWNSWKFPCGGMLPSWGQERGYMGQNLLALTAYFFAPTLHYAQMVLGISHILFSRGKSKGLNIQVGNRGLFKRKPAYESTMVLGFLSPSGIRVVFLWK